ncbi:MFS transporter [Oceanibacterium hippocampi]|nr:MFS transporter [Oceanibacterium hippocampi]
MNKRAAMIIVSLCVVYVISQFLRSSVAVIAPDFIRELSLDAEALGILTGAFFITFALTQIPTGILLDRYGARRTMSGLMLFAVAGCLVFARADGMVGLTVGRVLMGVGTAGLLAGSLFVIARWFASDRYAGMASLVIAGGSAGGLMATTPLAFAADWLGWRGVFLAVGATTLVFSGFAYASIRDAPPEHPFHSRRRENAREILRGLRDVWAFRDTRHVFAINLVCYGSLLTIIGLWGGPYLADVHDLDGVARGNVLLAMGVAMIVGNLIYGRLDRIFNTRKWIIVFGAVATLLMFVVLAVLPHAPVWQIAVAFSVLGAVGSYGVVIMAHGRSLYPEYLIGRGITTLNIAVMVGVAALQVAAGFVLGPYTGSDGRIPEDAYRLVFWMLAAVVACGLVAYLPVGDRRPHDGDP